LASAPTKKSLPGGKDFFYIESQNYFSLSRKDAEVFFELYCDLASGEAIPSGFA